MPVSLLWLHIPDSAWPCLFIGKNKQRADVQIGHNQKTVQKDALFLGSHFYGMLCESGCLWDSQIKTSKSDIGCSGKTSFLPQQYPASCITVSHCLKNTNDSNSTCFLWWVKPLQRVNWRHKANILENKSFLEQQGNSKSLYYTTNWLIDWLTCFSVKHHRWCTALFSLDTDQYICQILFPQLHPR